MAPSPERPLTFSSVLCVFCKLWSDLEAWSDSNLMVLARLLYRGCCVLSVDTMSDGPFMVLAGTNIECPDPLQFETWWCSIVSFVLHILTGTTSYRETSLHQLFGNSLIQSYRKSRIDGWFSSLHIFQMSRFTGIYQQVAW